MRFIQNRLLALVYGFSVALLGTSIAQAQFTLTIDTVENTWAFSGTDTGTGDPAGGPPGGSFFQFEGLNPALDLFFDQSFGTSFSVVGLPGAIASANLGYRPAFPGFSAAASAEFSLSLDVSGTQTITADGTEFSFASQPAADQLELEALIGTTLTLQQGTGFSPISVVAANAVPEPNALALLIAAMCPLALKRDRNMI